MISEVTEVASLRGSRNWWGSAIFEIVVALLSFGGLGFYVYFRILSVLPTVFGDELVYQRSSYSEEVASYLGNGLFSTLYGLTEPYGLDSYQYVKLINVVFLVGMGFVVYLYARQSMQFLWSLAFGAVAILGPISVYASFFMPEVMFSFLVAVFYVLFSFYISRPAPLARWAWLAGASLALAAASAVKPHALFLVPIGVLFIIMNSESVRMRLVRPTIFVMSVVAGNVLATLFFAPEGAPPLFGDYFGGVLGFLGSSSLPDVSNSPGIAEVGVATPAGSAMAFLAGSQLLLNLLSSMAFIGLPLGVLLASVVVLGRSPSFSLVSVSFLLIVFSVFTVYVTLTGDDHSDRVLLRYYEWLFLFVYIDAASTLLNIKERQAKFDVVVITFGILQVASIWITQTLGIDFQVSDSIFLAGLGLNLDSPYVLSGIIIIGTYLLSRRLVRPQHVVASAGILGLVAMGFSSQQTQIDINSKISGSDLAGIFLYENPEFLASKAGAIVGADRTLNQAVKFWSRDYDLDLYTVPFGSPIEVSENETPKIVVALDAVTLNPSNRVRLVHEGTDFNIYEILD